MRLSRNICYDPRDLSLIAEAEDEAKALGKSFSAYFVDLLRKALEGKQRERNIASTIPILNGTILGECSRPLPHIFTNNFERTQLYQSIKNAGNQELIEFSQEINDAREMIRSRRNEEYAVSRKKKPIKIPDEVLLSIPR